MTDKIAAAIAKAVRQFVEEIKPAPLNYGSPQQDFERVVEKVSPLFPRVNTAELRQVIAATMFGPAPPAGHRTSLGWYPPQPVREHFSRLTSELAMTGRETELAIAYGCGMWALNPPERVWAPVWETSQMCLVYAVAKAVAHANQWLARVVPGFQQHFLSSWNLLPRDPDLARGARLADNLLRAEAPPFRLTRERLGIRPEPGNDGARTHVEIYPCEPERTPASLRWLDLGGKLVSHVERGRAELLVDGVHQEFLEAGDKFMIGSTRNGARITLQRGGGKLGRITLWAETALELRSPTGALTLESVAPTGPPMRVLRGSHLMFAHTSGVGLTVDAGTGPIPLPLAPGKTLRFKLTNGSGELAYGDGFVQNVPAGSELSIWSAGAAHEGDPIVFTSRPPSRSWRLVAPHVAVVRPLDSVELVLWSCGCGHADCWWRHRLQGWDPRFKVLRGETLVSFAIEAFLRSAVCGPQWPLKAQSFSQGMYFALLADAAHW